MNVKTVNSIKTKHGLCFIPKAQAYSRITSTKSPSFCVKTFSTRLANVKVLLPRHVTAATA